MSEAQGRWSDLTARIGSGVVMVAIGLGAVLAGGPVFRILLALLCGAMVWELVRMLTPKHRTVAKQLGMLCAMAVLAAIYVPGIFVLPLLLAPLCVGISLIPQHKWMFAGFAALILFASWELMWLRSAAGVFWLLWLVLVVAASDILGYFAGRILGGPKFWPQVSPKKTWSGTIAGWVGAAIVGALFMSRLDVGLTLVALSIATAFAAQMGDIAESAIKRRVGVKDSSNLIPGHGGLLDRFDGMIGAGVFVFLSSAVLNIPAGAG